MKTLTTLTVVLLSLMSEFSYSQISDTIQAEKDALIRELSEVGDNINYGNYAYLNMHAWTNQSNTVVHRSLIDFDLSSIPVGSIINNAELQLYADKHSTDYPNGHESLTGSNRCFIRRVVTDWDEYTVTWNNQPAITTLNQVIIPESYSSTQNYVINVTALLQNMIDDTANSFGFLIKQQHEIYYRRMVFASKDNPDNTIRPKLIVTYINPSSIEINDKKHHHVSVYPNPTNSCVNIDFENNINKDFKLKLFNTQGILVKSIEHRSSEKIKLDISDLSSGNYILQIIADNKIYTVKKILVE